MVRTRKQDQLEEESPPPVDGTRKLKQKPPAAGWRNQDLTEDESNSDQEDSDDEMVHQLEDDGGFPPDVYLQAGTGPPIPANPKYRLERAVDNPDPDETDSTRNSSKCTTILIILLFAIGTTGCLYNYSKEAKLFMFEINEFITDGAYSILPRSKEPTGDNLDTLTPWDKFKHKFKTEFTPKYLNAVPKSSIKVIKAAVKDVMTAYENDDEIDKLSPSVILILGKEGNKNVSCFVRDLERMISSAYNEDNPVRLNGDTVDSKGIEDAFNDVFKYKKQHLIVIDGLNKLDGKSAAHLHRFTDHDLSVFKEAIIILLGYTDNVAQLKSESSLREMDSVASELIMKLWAQSLPSDTIAPLISRLTPSVTAVLDWDGKITIC